MDPGNWATDIEAGAHFGYALLWVVAVSSIAAMFLQLLTARLGLVTGQDLAQLSYQRYGPVGRAVQWFSAEVSIIACDVAEVLGCALAFNLLLGVPLVWGILLTVLDTLIVLGLKGRGFRQIEAIVLGLIVHSLMYAAQPAIMAEMFPTRMRYSGVSIGYQATALVAGSWAPLIATTLLREYESWVPIALYVLGSGAVSLIGALFLKETKGISLRALDEADLEMVRG